MIKKFLFPTKYNENKYSLMLLSVRLVFGIMLMTHGFQKLSNYSALAAGGFPDPLGIGSGLSVSLAIFGEVACSAAFILGFLYRLSMIPMIITMVVAFSTVHGGSVADGELAFIYLMIFIIMYVAGPGKFAVDNIISQRIYNKN